MNHRRRRQHRANWWCRGEVVLRFEQFTQRRVYFVHRRKYRARWTR